jgi:hypothetical protein
MAMTVINYKNETWHRWPVTPSREFIMGVDLGQSHDPTAICIMEHCRSGTGDWKKSLNASGGRTLIEQSKDQFDVRYLQRLPLGWPYPQIISYVIDILKREPLSDGCDLVIDITGVGIICGELFDGAGLRPIKVSITSGSDQTRVDQRRWNVSKTVLISSLDARLNTGELRIAKALADAPALAEELQDFRRLVTQAGNATYAARIGKHDDLVLAVAMATWWAANRKRGGEVSTGHIKI